MPSMLETSRWYKWGYHSHGRGRIIRRYRKVGGKIEWQTYPKKKYSGFSEDEITALLRRLNSSLDAEALEAKNRYDFHHAFINRQTMVEFERSLRTKINSKEHINSLMTTLTKYTLKYFVHTISAPNPNLWKKHEAGFGHFLLNQNKSSIYIKRIIQTANRLLCFLHQKYPGEIHQIRLEPLAARILENIPQPNLTRKKFISEQDFERICNEVDPRILPAVKLAYYFGLRRSEVLAVNEDCLYEDALQIDKQVFKVAPQLMFKRLKTCEQRLIPYWFCTPQQTLELIQSLVTMHPDTLGEIFVTEMRRINFPFQFHDLRRSWITRSLRIQHYLDVKQAAGHSDIETTNRYIQDDRMLSRKRFVPLLNVGQTP